MRDSNFRVKARRKTRNDRIAFPVRGGAGWIITITLVAVTNFATLNMQGEKVYGLRLISEFGNKACPTAKKTTTATTTIYLVVFDEGRSKTLVSVFYL